MNKIDSNFTGLAFAEESALKELPGTNEADAVWFELEPNSYNDFGGEFSNVARAPINASRQRKKGTITDLDVSGGFNIDVTQNNLTRLLQGFFFADAREKPSTAPLNGNAVAITSVSASTDTFAAASGLDIFVAGSLVLASGFGVAANNGLAVVTSATGTGVVTSKALTDEASPPATAKLLSVGFEFGSGDLTLTASASSIVLGCTAADFTTLGLNVGEWIFIGGDAAGNKFANPANVPGYGRIKSIAAKSLELSETTFAATTDAGTGKSIRIFFGTVIRNEKDTTLIKRRSYNLERQLGNDGNGTQSEYLLGAIPNEFTLNIPLADKLNADLTFVAMDNVQRTGTQGLKAGTRNGALGEDAFNTSSDIYRLRMNVVDPLNLNNTALFGYVSEMSVTVNNNISPSKGIGVLGAFDATVGDFEVSGSLTAYFTTVAAVQAVRNNSDVALNIIVAQNNAGVVFDIPLLALGGGRINVEKDAPVTVPLESTGAENAAGYTMLATFLHYIPNAGMPS